MIFTTMLWSLLLSTCAAQVIHPDLGLDNVKQYAGSFNTTHGSLFFYMYESRGSPCDDPLIVWLNGGPGGSSMPAMIFENGPSQISLDGSLNHNPYSWNEFANVVYIDNPVGTGFSGLNDPENPVDNSADAAVDFVDFFNEFYSQFPYLAQTDLHLAGESYAGTYIPVYAEALVKDGKPVKSLIIGNGQVDFGQTILGTPDIYCGKIDGISRLLTEQQCSDLYASMPACEASIKTCEKAAAHGDYDACDEVNDACGLVFAAPNQFAPTGGNPYNVKKECTDGPQNFCYSIIGVAADFFKNAKTKEALGFSSDFDYEVTSGVVAGNWDQREGFSGIQHRVERLIDNGVDVLAYSGANDGLVPFQSTQYWTTNLTWSGAAQFQASAESPLPWSVNGVQKGEISNYGPLTLLKVFDAGHLLPLEQPEAASAMIKAWIKGQHTL